MSGGMQGAGGVPETLLDTKGQIHGYSDENVAVDVSTNNYSIYADSTATPGLAYGPTSKSTLDALGSMLYASSANTLAKISPGAETTVLTMGASSVPAWAASSAGAKKFVYGRGLAAFGDAGYVYYPIFSGSAQYGGTESQHTQKLYFEYTITRNQCTVITNAMGTETYIYVQDDGASVAGITVSSGGTGDFESGALTTVIASQSDCCYARNGNSSSASITVNGIITTCET